MSIRKDDTGQMYMIEAVLAVTMMLAALYIVMVLTPVDITPRQDFAEVQLYHYGRDVLTLLSHPFPGIAGGHLEYDLYREHNSTRWTHDNTTNVTHRRDGLNWTDEFLYINHDVRRENLTVRFLLFDRVRWIWVEPTGIPGGRLEIRTVPAPGGEVVRHSTTNNFTFRHETGDDRNFTLNIIWFEFGANISKPLLVWVDMHPANYTAMRNMAIIAPRLVGQDKLWNSTEIGQGGSITVRVDPGAPSWNRFMLNDRVAFKSDGTDLIADDGITMVRLDPNTFRFTFDRPAKGGYAIFCTSGASTTKIRAGPVYVTVGEPGIVVMPGVGLALSPLEASIGPGGVGYLFSELERTLRAYLPENVGWNFYVLDANNMVINNWNGDRMEIINGIPAPGAIVVNVPVFSTVDGATYSVYMAKLVLWYR